MNISDEITPSEIVSCVEEGSLVSLYERIVLGRMATQVQPPDIVVEIGTFNGATAAIMRRFAPDVKITAVDIAPQDAAYRIAREYDIDLQVCDSVEAAGACDESIGLLFIDGTHYLDDALRDWTAWAPKCRDGAWVALHDYTSPFPGIISLCDALVATNRLSDPMVVDCSLVGRLQDPSPPPQDAILTAMDAVVPRYRRLGELLARIPEGVTDLGSRLGAALRDGLPPMRIVGRGLLGMRTAADMGCSYDACIDSSEAKNDGALYVIAGTPENQIRRALKDKGIPEGHILTPEQSRLLSEWFRVEPPVPEDKPLSRILLDKLLDEFNGQSDLLHRYKTLYRILPGIPDAPPFP